MAGTTRPPVLPIFTSAYMNLLRGYGKQPGSTRRVREFNDCNLPKGESDGGRFGRNDDPRCKTKYGPPRPSIDEKEGMASARYNKAHDAYMAAPVGSPEEEAARLARTAAHNQRSELRFEMQRKRDAHDETKTTLVRLEHDIEREKRRAAGIADPELTSQDTKKSSTKKLHYEEGDNVDSVYGDSGPSIFGGMDGETVAHEMTKYIDEEMDASIRASVDGGGGGGEAGPDPSDAETKRDYERYQEEQLDRQGSAHYEDRTQEFKNYATKAYIDTGLTASGIMQWHAKHFLDNPGQLPPPEVDPNQQTLDLDGDPATADFNRPPQQELTVGNVIAILDKHGVLNREPGTPNPEAGDGDTLVERLEDEIEAGSFTKQFRVSDVRAAIMDPDSAYYDDPNVTAAREEILALRPTALATTFAQSQQVSDVNPPQEWIDAIDEQTAAVFADGGYLSQTAGRTGAELTQVAGDWYSETNQSDEIEYDVKSFDEWYESKYGHDPSEWEDRLSGGLDFDGSQPGEVSIEFTGADGSSITRVFTRDSDGSLSVYHSYFTNSGPAGQGKGLMRGQMELYEQLGVSEVTTTANISTGSYAWARYGFTAKNPGELVYAVNGRLDAVLKAAPELTAAEAQIRDIIEQHENDEYLPWRVADMRITGSPEEMKAIAARFTSGTRGTAPISDIRYIDDYERWNADLMRDAENGVFNLGKVLMVGHNWSARFDMTDATHRARMRDYIGDWTTPASQQVERGPSRDQLRQARAEDAMAGRGEGQAIADRVTKQPKAAAQAAGAGRMSSPRGAPVQADSMSNLTDAPVGTRVERMTNAGRITGRVKAVPGGQPGENYVHFDQDSDTATRKHASGYADDSWTKKTPRATTKTTSDLATAKTSRATALRDGRVPREDYGNTADEVRQTERTLKNAPDGARVSRTLVDGRMVYGQVTNRGATRVITPDDPDEVYQHHNRQFVGGWHQSPEQGPTERRGQKVTNMMTTPAGTRVKADTPRGRLYGRVQGRSGQRGVTLRDSPSRTMQKLLSAGNRGIQWRKK